MCGIDRYFLYLTACATGFRAGELASIVPAAFDLASDPPTITVTSSCTKNRREALQPLPSDVAEALTDYLRGKPAGIPVWPGKWRGWRMMKADLRVARRGWLEESTNARERDERDRSDFLSYRDAQGRYADFHALRHSYITAIGKTGASPKVHQELARHSTYAMTGRYTHARLHDLAATVAALPPLLSSQDACKKEAVAATGTEGKPVEAPGCRVNGQERLWGAPDPWGRPGGPCRRSTSLGNGATGSNSDGRSTLRKPWPKP